MTNAPGANAYPITATTFILMHKQPKDKAKSDAALGFFRWALENGQAAGAEARLCPAAGRPGEADRDLYRRQPSSERSPPPAAPRSGAGADRLFRLVTAGAAWLVLLAARRRRRVDGVGRPARVRDLRLGLHHQPRLGRGRRQVRRAGADLRHAGHLAHRAADRGAGQHRHRPVPDRHRAALAARADRHRHRAARGDPEHHLRHVGPVRVRAVHGDACRAVAQRHLGTLPVDRRAVHRAADRHRHAHRRRSCSGS